MSSATVVWRSRAVRRRRFRSAACRANNDTVPLFRATRVWSSTFCRYVWLAAATFCWRLALHWPSFGRCRSGAAPFRDGRSFPVPTLWRVVDAVFFAPHTERLHDALGGRLADGKVGRKKSLSSAGLAGPCVGRQRARRNVFVFPFSRFFSLVATFFCCCCCCCLITAPLPGALERERSVRAPPQRSGSVPKKHNNVAESQVATPPSENTRSLYRVVVDQPSVKDLD